MTCTSNDYGFEEIFGRGVEAYGKEGDVLIAISTSGNSPNVINAVTKAAQMKMITFGLLGKEGGKLLDSCDYELIVPGKTTDRIQEIHITVLHIIIETIERILFPDNYLFYITLEHLHPNMEYHPMEYYLYKNRMLLLQLSG